MTLTLTACARTRARIANVACVFSSPVCFCGAVWKLVAPQPSVILSGVTPATDAAEMSFESPPTGVFEDVNMDDLGMDEAYMRVHNVDGDVAYLYGRSEDCDKCSFESYGAVRRAFILRSTAADRCNEEAKQVLGGGDGLSCWDCPFNPRETVNESDGRRLHDATEALLRAMLEISRNSGPSCAKYPVGCAERLRLCTAYTGGIGTRMRAVTTHQAARRFPVP